MIGLVEWGKLGVMHVQYAFKFKRGLATSKAKILTTASAQLQIFHRKNINCDKHCEECISNNSTCQVEFFEMHPSQCLPPPLGYFSDERTRVYDGKSVVSVFTQKPFVQIKGRTLRLFTLFNVTNME